MQTCDLFADLFGRLLRELALNFMPREGDRARRQRRTLAVAADGARLGRHAGRACMRHIPEAVLCC